MLNEKKELLKRGFEYTLGFIVFVWVMIVNVGIITRYVLKVSIPWSEELTVLLFNWVIFIGAAMASMNRGHITITILEDALRGKAKTILLVIQNLLFIVFVGVASFQSWKIVLLQARTEQFTAILNIPVYITTLALSLGSLIWLAILCIDTVQLVLTNDEASEVTA